MPRNVIEGKGLFQGFILLLFFWLRVLGSLFAGCGCILFNSGNLIYKGGHIAVILAWSNGYSLNDGVLVDWSHRAIDFSQDISP
ncbi:MAG: hypothetical protein BWY80_01462 [Firmicutes bacterium ADurb.Bin456]|nr:MAG: hypothetical protein BWY80_01462 [Firmicutes bacterium ADurb.Bin456]